MNSKARVKNNCQVGFAPLLSVLLFLLLAAGLMAAIFLVRKTQIFQNRATSYGEKLSINSIPNAKILTYGVTTANYQKYKDAGIFEVANVAEINSYNETMLSELRSRGVTIACHVGVWADSGCLGGKGRTGDTSEKFCLQPQNKNTCIQRIVDRATRPFASGFNAVALDEFLGTTVITADIESQAIKAIRQKFPNSQIYVWTILGNQLAKKNLNNPNYKKAIQQELQDLNANATLLMEEAYLSTPKTPSSVKNNNDWINYLTKQYFPAAFNSRASALQKTAPGVLEKTVFGLTVDGETLVANTNAELDFNRFLSLEIQTIRTGALTSKMPGVAAFHPAFASVETNRFFYQAAKKYFLDGTDISFGTGPVISPLKNPGFEFRLRGWQASSSDKTAKASVKTYQQAGLDYSNIQLLSPGLNGRKSQISVPEGKYVLYLERGQSSSSFNSVSQALTNLSPNQEYEISALYHKAPADSPDKKIDLLVTDANGKNLVSSSQESIVCITVYAPSCSGIARWTLIHNRFTAPADGSITVAISDQVANPGDKTVVDFVQLNQGV